MYLESVEHLRWSFLRNYLTAKIHLKTISTKSFILAAWLGYEYVFASFFPRNIYILLGEEVSQEKNGRIKELIFANIWWNFAEQAITSTKNMSLHNLLK